MLNSPYKRSLNKFPFKEFSIKNFSTSRTISLAEKFKIQAAKRNRNYNNNSLMKITNKTFLSKMFGGFLQGLVFDRVKKEEEYVEISEPVIFENGKLLILEMEHSGMAHASNCLMYVSYPIIAFAGYKLILALSSFSVLRSLLWTSILIFSLNSYFSLRGNREFIIKEISILQDGKTCEVKTLKGVFSVDINKIRKINLEEAIYMAQTLEIIKSRFIPIVMDTKLYVIPLESRILRKDFLPHISEGKYLRFDEIIQKDKTIQI